jgi:hypothetical protein
MSSVSYDERHGKTARDIIIAGEIIDRKSKNVMGKFR